MPQCAVHGLLGGLAAVEQLLPADRPAMAARALMDRAGSDGSGLIAILKANAFVAAYEAARRETEPGFAVWPMSSALAALLIAGEHEGQDHAQSPALGVNGESSGAANPLIPLHCPHSVSATITSRALSCAYISTLYAALASCLSVSAHTLVHTMRGPSQINDPPQMAARSAARWRCALRRRCPHSLRRSVQLC